LEFLGDAILDYVAADYLFRRFRDMQEGEMTALRAALVKTESLASFAACWDLGEYLYLGRGEEASGGRMRLANLCAAFEALIGAVYLDGGMESVQRLVKPLLVDKVNLLLAEVGQGRERDRLAIKDAKSRLQEFSQSRYHLTPLYRTIAERGPDHEKEFTVEVLVGGVARGQGIGRSKQAAEQVAARMALIWLTGESQEQKGEKFMES